MMNMQYTVLLCVTLSLLLKEIHGKDTSCAQSQKLFADLCFTPAPPKDFDIQWVASNQPDEGWHIDLGNDIARLHMAEVLKGKLLPLDDDFEDMCARIKLEHLEGQERDDGKFFGFGNLTSPWNCSRSMDFPGILRCDLSSSGLSKYKDKVNIYFTYTDSNNLSIAVQCYPNGEVGWVTSSVTPLTEEEKKVARGHAQSLGFPVHSTVTIAQDTCPRNY